MELTWYGHSTWQVDIADTTLLIDPFFENPQTSHDPTTIPQPDYVLLTHGHADHIAHANQFAGAPVVGTPELVAYLEDEYDIEETIGMNIGGTIACGDGTVTMHRADHSNGINTGYENSAGMPAGYIIGETAPTAEEGTQFYHAGDTGLMTGMRDIIGEILQPDAAAVPIGDHFTMGPQQAAVAVDWLGVDVAFPMHYDTFPPIEVDPDRFATAVADTGSDATVRILDGDESVTVSE